MSTPGSEQPPLDVTGLLRRIRRRADLSQRELAHRLGVSAALVGHWEAGRRVPSIDLFERAAGCAGLSVVLVDEAGVPVAPMRSAGAAVDGARRRYPAHLDLTLTHGFARPEPGQPWVRTWGRWKRELLRARSDEAIQEDHPTVAELRQRQDANRAAAEARRPRLAPRPPEPPCSCPPGCDEVGPCVPGCPCRCGVDLEPWHAA